MMKNAIAGNNGAMYEHIAAEEHRLELERTREELHAAKKQLTDRDAELLQLKTAHRKLQDALRKKDKDLQNVFAVLRAPQDAELTRKRKTELVERLLTETQQRVVNTEAVAEERRRELEKLKFSSKFLRNQELEVEIEECYAEIERLRVELGQYAVVGKLKVSQATVNGIERAKTPAKPARRSSGGNQHSESTATRDDSAVPVLLQRTVQAVKPLPTQSTHKRESFVDKTRRAVELEYSKQLRLAELEAECELEENLRIRAKREAQAQVDARRRKSQHDQIKSSKLVVVAAVLQPPEPIAEAVVNPVASVEDVAQAVVVESDPSASTQDPTATPATDVVVEKTALAVELKECSAIVSDDVPVEREVSAGEDKALDASVAAVMEDVVDAVEHEPLPVVAEAPQPQQPKQYDEDDFDDGVDEKDDHDSESIIDDVAATANQFKPAIPPAVEKDEKELEEEVEEDSGEKSKLVEQTPEPPSQEEVYEADDEPEDVVSETHEAGGPRQGFVVSIDPKGKEEEVYEPPEQEHKQGFVVEPTYDSGASTERGAASTERAESPAESPRNEEEDEEKEERKMLEGSDKKATEVESPQEEDVHQPGEEEPTPVSREEPESPTETVTSEKANEASDHHAIAIEESERDAPIEGAREKDVVAETGLSEQVDSSRSDGAATEREESSQPSESLSSRTADDDSNPQAAGAEGMTDRTPSEAVAAERAAPLADVHHEVARTLHDCDDAIDAATATIHRQIDSALSDALSPSSIETSSPPTDANAELTASELAAAMDSAARKIQRFWREMERKYAPTQADPTVIATPRSGHSGASTPMESAESPVVSETESW